MTLRALSDRRDVRFEDETFDVRNQEVRSRINDERIGKVDDVLVDDFGRTRYLSLAMDGENRRVLVPVGETEADRQKNVVWVSALNRESFRSLPAYDGNAGAVSSDYEHKLRTAYDGAYPEERHYERPEYRNTAWSSGATRNETGRLERVDKLDDIGVASGEPDPRGWPVFGVRGQELGKIDHLIGDTRAMKVRYVVMKVDRKVLQAEPNVLIPVGQIDLDTRRNRVTVNTLDATTMKTLPVYGGGVITRDEERRICAVYSDACTDDRKYEHARFRDENLYGNASPQRSGQQTITRSEEELHVGTRERKAGEVEVRKSVETERVRTPVTTHREEVEIERRPATGQNTAARIGDQEIVVPLTEEEVVVEKRPQVKEEIVVRKRNVADRQVIEEDVRKERVEVDETREGR